MTRLIDLSWGRMFLLIATATLAVPHTATGVDYGTPEGGWFFQYDGGPDFNDLFTHNNNSDAWDGLGLADGQPGGIESFTEAGDTFVRLVDTGDPRDHGFGDADPSNRKIKLVHGLELEDDPLELLFDKPDHGLTMYFRLRIVPGDALAGVNVLPDGGGAPMAWPAEGKGQSDIRFEGSGWLGVDSEFGSIAFSMDYAANSNFYDQDGLALNDLVLPSLFPEPADSSSGNGGPDGLNFHPLENLTEWQDIWVTIRPLDPLDPNDLEVFGTHEVTVYANGDMQGVSYELTAGTWDDAFLELSDAGTPMPAIHFGPNPTDDYSAMDLDLFYVTPGIHAPVVPDVVPLPGDLDGDGDVDSADMTGVILNWTGALDEGTGTATPDMGDIDGDQDVDSADFTDLILNWTGAKAGNMDDGDHADLVYNPATGEVSIDPSDTESKKTVSFVLSNPAGNMTPIAESKLPIFQVAQGDNTNRQIGFTDLTLGGKEGVLELGPIFPPGMSQEQLGEFLATAKYAYALGKGGDLDLVVLPEPGALALAALGLAGLLGCPMRCRRNRETRIAESGSKIRLML